MLDLDYTVFVAIAESRSITAAAHALCLSPASISKRLVRLEKRLGVTLVHRTTRHVSLSDEGVRFYRDAASILESVRKAETQFVKRSNHELTGVLRITAPTSFGRLHVAPYLVDFLKAHAKLKVEIDLSDNFVDLHDGNVDVAIRIAPRIAKGLCKQRLATSQRVMCASTAYLRRVGTPQRLADLGHHALLAADGQLPWRLQGPHGPALVKGESYVRTNSSEVVRELCITGVGIALRSLWDVGPDLAAKRLQRILPNYEGSNEVGIFAVYRPPMQPLPAVNAFIGHYQKIYATPPW